MKVKLFLQFLYTVRVVYRQLANTATRQRQLAKGKSPKGDSPEATHQNNFLKFFINCSFHFLKINCSFHNMYQLIYFSFLAWNSSNLSLLTWHLSLLTWCVAHATRCMSHVTLFHEQIKGLVLKGEIISLQSSFIDSRWVSRQQINQHGRSDTTFSTVSLHFLQQRSQTTSTSTPVWWLQQMATQEMFFR